MATIHERIKALLDNRNIQSFRKPGGELHPLYWAVADRSDDRGPFIAYWGEGLGPYPTVADGFSEYEVNGHVVQVG